MTIDDLLKTAKSVVDAVTRDDCGEIIGGQWVGGNGGLLSRDTIALVDQLRRELDHWNTYHAGDRDPNAPGTRPKTGPLVDGNADDH